MHSHVMNKMVELIYNSSYSQSCEREERKGITFPQQFPR